MRRTFACLVVISALLGACASKDKPPVDTTTGDTVTTPSTGSVDSGSGYDAAPPWPLDGHQYQRMQEAGIQGLTAEGTFVHYHAHLDVFYDGQRVEVPANIGIDFDAQRISPMHTHTNSGVIHIEANMDEKFTLGQFLTEWGVKAVGGCIADKCGNDVNIFVNGSIQDESPTGHVIKADTEIALVLGTTPPADIPSTYDCSQFPSDVCPNIPH